MGGLSRNEPLAGKILEIAEILASSTPEGRSSNEDVSHFWNLKLLYALTQLAEIHGYLTVCTHTQKDCSTPEGTTLPKCIQEFQMLDIFRAKVSRIQGSIG